LMKRYSLYKNSGVRWIGEVPCEWDTLKIKWLSPVKRGASPRPIDDPKYFNDDGEFSWVRIADVTASERYLERTTQTLSELGSSLSVKRNPGDFFVSIAGTVGKPVITKIKCCIHDGFVYFPLLRIDPEFLYFVFSAGELFNGLGKLGTQLNLNTETVGNIHIPRPTGLEIAAVVKYLDHKTHLIDTLIEKKQKQIELLQEQRAAVINQAVTKGLNPNVKMKDSGIEWLGEVPEHWQTTRLKFETSHIVDCLHSTPVYSENGGYPAIRTADVSPGVLDLADVRFVDKEEYKQRISRLQPEAKDILYSREGERFGMAALVPHDVDLCLSQRMMMFRPRKSVNPIFLMWQLNSRFVYYQASQDVIGATSPHVNVKTIRNFSLVMPPYKEQTEIAENIHTECANIDAIIGSVSRVIKALQEYRTTLMSEVVTGKIDVRNEVIP